MSESWKTKWGTRRVRHDPPTLAEALAAAACFTEDRQQQAEIAAELMGVSIAAAVTEAGRLARERRGTITVATAPSRDKSRLRTVVIERRTSRRVALGSGPEDAAGGFDRSPDTSRPPATVHLRASRPR